MLRQLQIFWLYYKKICVPTLFFTLAISLYGSGVLAFSFSRFGQSYFMIALVVHFVQYGLRYKNEKYFFNNLGLDLYKLIALALIANTIITFTALLIPVIWN